ncbi:MAG TPA: DNA-binding protein YbiB [Usitatibacter sp.]|nr:DNA-binding protein YbiB [Usitatibacter sp.]
MSDFDARPYLKEIARGRHGARDLTREQARTLFAAIFAGDVNDVALGAILAAYRIKGEKADELAGMMDALAPHVHPVRLPMRRVLPVVIPTYNGARKLPNLVALLALMLAREGVPVLVHGVAQEPQRVSTFEVLERLGHPAAASIAQAEQRLEQDSLAAVPIGVLSPALAKLLDARLVMGLRSAAHTLAKMVLPANVGGDAALRLLPVTHPDFQSLMREHFAAFPGHVMLMRGVEGEAIVRLHAPQPIEQVDPTGALVTRLFRDCDAPALPTRDADATAQWTQEVLDGRIATPAAIQQQAALIADQCREAARTRPPLKLVSSS